MKDEFKLKNVTIHIDQTLLEQEKGCYYLRAINPSSPVSCWGTPDHIGQTFGKWLSDTITAMEKNNCKLIKIDLSWE